jgi:VanZ family protein
VLASWLHNGAHVVAYAALGSALVLAGPGQMARTGGWWWLGSWALATVYGGVDEWHQSWVPGRTASLADLLSDALGAALGVALVHAARAWDRRQAIRLSALLLAGLASVTLATFGPW